MKRPLNPRGFFVVFDEQDLRLRNLLCKNTFDDRGYSVGVWRRRFRQDPFLFCVPVVCRYLHSLWHATSH
jgi:hypothetical protein